MPNAKDRRSFSLLETVRRQDEPNEGGRRSQREEAKASGGSQSRVMSDAPELLPGVGRGTNSGSDAEARIIPDGADDPRFPSGPRITTVPSDDVAGEDVVLPQRLQARRWGGIISFVVCVVLPTIGAAIYYAFFASSQYSVEWRFAVRDTSTAASTSSAASGLTALLGVSSSSSTLDNFMVTEYIKSRQAVEDLEARIGLIARYSKPSIDFWSRFDGALPLEKFVNYWRYMVTASFDTITGTAIAEVRAFSPEDAYLISKTLVSLCEDLVNEVVQRPQREAVLYAEAEVKRAEKRLKEIRAEMTEYRNKEAVIDPNTNVVLSNATLASALRAQLAQYQTDLIAMQQGGLAKNASQIQSMRVRIKATQDQLRDIEQEVSRPREGSRPLSDVVSRYEQLTLELQFAQNMMTSTFQSLEQARSNAMAKRIFITPFVHPNKPQSSTYPDRVVAVLIVAGACMLLWTVALLLGRSIREHLA